MTSNLEIRIDSAGLSTIYGASQSVTLVRQLTQVVNGAGPSTTMATVSQLAVAWVAFAPMQVNTIVWSEQYFCFATTTPMQMGQVITMNAKSAAAMQAGMMYAFTNGQFVLQSGQAGASAYIIENLMSGKYLFGLAQQATVNGASALSPICDVPVLLNQAAYFMPTDQVSIFLSSVQTSGTLLPPPINPLRLTVGSNTVVGFNDQTNSFFQLS